MKKNVGTIDKVLRYVLSGLLTALAFTLFPVQHGSVLGWIFLVLAVVFTVTASLSFCPIWMALGIRTTKKN